MSDPDDLFEMYRNDRGGAAALKGDALAHAIADNVRRTFATMEKLVAEVVQVLAQARYAIRVGPTVTDRATYVRLDRTSESFRDYLRMWSQQRAEGGGGMHWEAQILVTDHRRASAEIGLGVTIERPVGADGGDVAFVEFWTTGQGMPLPSEGRAFQRALVASIVRLEEAGTLRSAKPKA
ncbi:hypothetical protein [Azospirillum sp.]|uniref:hypothetical protein n=1 Tax=Azospirillum sp. TaxID=34012 RepID=UPI002D448413|nr:hypothetical protein [Azospirillum sp.]HYD66618.1 hypothetical protein [Azospirillum sp.]